MSEEQMRYSEEHMGVKLEGDTARVGLSDFAQAELGELTFIELPEPGDQFARSDVVCSIDSLKAASDIYAPVSCTIREINAALLESGGPALVNKDPLGDGWLFTIALNEISDLEQLLSEDDYRKLIKT